MKFLRNLIGHSLLVAGCALLLEAAGTPVAQSISWGADQIRGVTPLVRFADWAEREQVDNLTQPVRRVVTETVEWVESVATTFK
jgi:hypothetical protein